MKCDSTDILHFAKKQKNLFTERYSEILSNKLLTWCKIFISRDYVTSNYNGEAFTGSSISNILLPFCSISFYIDSFWRNNCTKQEM